MDTEYRNSSYWSEGVFEESSICIGLLNLLPMHAKIVFPEDIGVEQVHKVKSVNGVGRGIRTVVEGHYKWSNLGCPPVAPGPQVLDAHRHGLFISWSWW